MTYDIRVGSRPSSDQDDGVDDRGQNLDSSIGNGDGEGTTGSITSVAQELGVVVRHDERDDEDSEDVKGDDSEKDSTDGTGNGSSRVSGLSNGYGDDFGTCK